MPACVGVRGERVGLPAGPMQRQHPLAAQTLAQRVLGHEPVELGEQLVVPAQRKVGVDAVLDGGQPALVQIGGVASR